jgi:hypothetical protein
MRLAQTPTFGPSMLLGPFNPTGKMYKDRDFAPWLTAGVDGWHVRPRGWVGFYIVVLVTSSKFH